MGIAGSGERRSAIEAIGVSKIFGGGDDAVKALDDVDVTIRENEFFTLLGPSGCGKTTLLRLIAGFDFPTEGEIRLYGDDIAPLPPFKRPVNTVFQNYALFPHMTVAQNIGFGLEMLGKPRPEIDARVSEMLKLVRMAKSVTAAAAGCLVAQGLLDPDALITYYLPELEATAYRGARLRHVLDMAASTMPPASASIP